jgi:hypothetical protein
MKMEQTGKYLQRRHITYTKEGAKFSDSEIDDFYIPAQLIHYAKVGGSRNYEHVVK